MSLIQRPDGSFYWSGTTGYVQAAMTLDGFTAMQGPPLPTTQGTGIIQDERWWQTEREWFPAVSVGAGGSGHGGYIPSLPAIPWLGQWPTTQAPTEIFEAPTEGGTPVVDTPSLPPLVPTGPVASNEAAGSEENTIFGDIMDIFDWGDLIDWGTDIYAASQQPDQVVIGQTGAPAVTGTTTVPAMPDGTDPRTKVCYVFDKATGQWVLKKKTRRRRKRQLATKGDIRDLAALISVLGNGQNLKTWIATHG